MSDTVIITVEEVKAETDAALLVLYEGQEVWLPKSQLPGCDAVEGDTDVDIEVTQWILEEKGLV